MTVGKAFEPDDGEILPRDCRALCRRRAEALKPQLHIFLDCAPREQPVVLKNGDVLDMRRTHLLARNADAAARHAIKACKCCMERRLATARGTEQTDKLAALNREAHMMEGVELRSIFVVNAGNIRNLNVAHAFPPMPQRR